jgi:uncharacterized protein (DUF1778 family)
MRMGRPPKEPRLRMTDSIRLPLTADQKRTIEEAAALDQTDVTAWIRPILMEAARKRIAREAKA